jgi:hypothetical protein
MMWPKTMAEPIGLWLSILLLCVGACFDLVATTQKIDTYEDCLQEAYEWHTWTGVEIIRVMCIRFPLQGVH